MTTHGRPPSRWRTRRVAILAGMLFLAMWLVLLEHGAKPVELSLFLGAAILLAGFASRAAKIDPRASEEGPLRNDEKSAREDGAPASQLTDTRERMSALESQINPHFLYNTLESIRGQALSEGSKDIARTTEALAAFFRYSISSRGHIVTLRDEIGNIRNYFFIQQYRFGDRFRLAIEMDDEDGDIFDCLLPKLTLQPIVENALFHGLESKDGGGAIRVSLVTTPARLLITVSDDGVGMDGDTLETLNGVLRGDSAFAARRRAAHHEGIALSNVSERIKLAFGSAYGLRIYSTPNRGTDVEISLPRVKEASNLSESVDDDGTRP